MIIGVDLGNFSTKSSTGVNFMSKVSTVGNILNNKITLQTSNGIFYMGEGEFDTEYRKLKKQYIKEMFTTAVALSSNEINNQIVVGLPLSQYKEDKDALKELLLKDRLQHIVINNIERKLITEDIKIYPEGISALIGTNFNGIIIDIGGRTSDLAILESGNIKQPFSMAVGTLNLYSDFIKLINNKYSLDLKSEDAIRILRDGLEIYGVPQDIRFAMTVFKTYVESITNELQVSYSIKTLNIMLVGGGAELLYQAFRNRIPNVQLVENALYANSQGFLKVGENEWL